MKNVEKIQEIKIVESKIWNLIISSSIQIIFDTWNILNRFFYILLKMNDLNINSSTILAIRGQRFTWVWMSKILNDSSKRNLVVLMHFWWEYQQQTKIIVKMIERWFSVNNFLSRLDLISFFCSFFLFVLTHVERNILTARSNF